MSGVRPEHGASITVETCPGCASHLSDTWDGEECIRCGFQYVHEQTRREFVDTGSRRRYDISPARVVGSQFVAVLSLILASFSGMTISDASESMFQQTAEGVLIPSGGGFPPEFWWGTVLFGVSTLLLAGSMEWAFRGARR